MSLDQSHQTTDQPHAPRGRSMRLGADHAQC
jgi:hypothetical protein